MPPLMGGGCRLRRRLAQAAKPATAPLEPSQRSASLRLRSRSCSSWLVLCTHQTHALTPPVNRQKARVTSPCCRLPRLSFGATPRIVERLGDAASGLRLVALARECGHRCPGRIARCVFVGTNAPSARWLPANILPCGACSRTAAPHSRRRFSCAICSPWRQAECGIRAPAPECRPLCG